MFWQKKAWANRQVCLHWSETAPKDHLGEHHVCSYGTRQDTLHLYENNDKQILSEFIQLIRIYHSFCQFFPTNVTEDLAPPDAGLIALIKYCFFLNFTSEFWSMRKFIIRKGP